MVYNESIAPHEDGDLDDRLLDAAKELFDEHKIEDVTVADVAERAGVDMAKARRRFHASAYIVRGIYEKVLDEAFADLDAQEYPASDLHARLCHLVISEIRQLKSHKRFVQRSLLELLRPTSTQLLVQLPVLSRLVAQVSEQIAEARRLGAVSRWVSPNVASLLFNTLHAEIFAYWVTVDDSSDSEPTLALLDRQIGVFVRSLRHPLRMFEPRPASMPDPPSAPPMNLRTKPVAGSASSAGRKKKQAARRD
jgi:AcrR family transcriptional regulator